MMILLLTLLIWLFADMQETVTCTTIRTNQFLHRNRKTQNIDEVYYCRYVYFFCSNDILYVLFGQIYDNQLVIFVNKKRWLLTFIKLRYITSGHIVT